MAFLSQLQKKIQNTANRQSQVFLRTEQLDTNGPSYAVDNVSTADDYFEVYEADLRQDGLASGQKIYVDNSTGNDSVYTVKLVSVGEFGGQGGSDTRIETEEPIEDETADGTIYLQKEYSYVNLGRVVDVSFTAEPLSSDADQDGRESAQTFDCTVQVTMMQASEVEMSLLPQLSMPSTQGYDFYRNGHTLYFSGQPQITESDVNDAVVHDPDPMLNGNLVFGDQSDQLDDSRGLHFSEVMLKPTAEVNLQGENSLLPIEFTGRIVNDAFASIDTSQTFRISFK
jgi:hypothetical protein